VPGSLETVFRRSFILSSLMNINEYYNEYYVALSINHVPVINMTTVTSLWSLSAKVIHPQCVERREGGRHGGRDAEEKPSVG